MNHPVVIARIRGGLGNQLFMYAMARRLAHVNNAELAFDDRTSFRGKNKYGRQYMLNRFPIKGRIATAAECREPFDSLRRSLVKWRDKNRPLHEKHFVTDPGGLDPAIYSMKIERPTTFEGYWQTEKWFDEIADEIRAECTPEAPTDADNQRSAAAIAACTAVALHVRFFNDPTQTAQSKQVLEYYSDAVKTIREKVENPKFFIFSDQPEKAREILALDSSESYVVDHNAGDAKAHLDLWLMSKCQHFITANSTFSWWGAWLGEKPNSVVVTPVFTAADAFLAWGLPGTIPDRWIRID